MPRAAHVLRHRKAASENSVSLDDFGGRRFYFPRLAGSFGFKRVPDFFVYGDAEL